MMMKDGDDFIFIIESEKVPAKAFLNTINYNSSVKMAPIISTSLIEGRKCFFFLNHNTMKSIHSN